MIITHNTTKCRKQILNNQPNIILETHNAMLLGEKLQWIIEEKRTKVTQVALAVDCAASTLYAIIQKNDADTKILRKLSDYFNIELPWWLDEKSQVNPFNASPINLTSKNIQSHFNTTTQSVTTSQEDAQQKVELMMEKSKNENLKNLLKEKDKLLDEKDKTILSQEKTITILQETMIMINNRK